MLKHQTISIRSADWIFVVLGQFHREILQLQGIILVWKKSTQLFKGSSHGLITAYQSRMFQTVVFCPTLTNCVTDLTVKATFHFLHDDVIKWKHFPRNWPFVREIHRSPVNSPHKRQWRGALMFSLICVWINDWVNNREAGDLRRYRAHSDVIVMLTVESIKMTQQTPSEWTKHREGIQHLIRRFHALNCI